MFNTKIISKTEESYLLDQKRSSQIGLPLIFAIICIVDIFGIYPIIALPKPIIDCGYCGPVLVALICSTQIYTAILLGKCWLIAEIIEPSIKEKNRYPYSALTEMIYGKHLAKFVTFLLDLSVFSAGVPSLILASQILQFLGLKISQDVFNLSFCYWMLIIGMVICPFLWLGSPKDMKLLCSISVLLVLSVFILILISLTRTSIPKEQPTKGNKMIWNNVITAYGILAFQFDIHPTVLTIQVDMKSKEQIPTAIVWAFIGLFLVTSMVVYEWYSDIVTSNILDTLPSSTPTYLAAVLIAVQLGLSAAISNSALYQHVENCLGIPRDFNGKRCLVRSGLAILSVLVAESVPRFDLVMSLIGGLLTGPLVFILPPLFYLKILLLQQQFEQNTGATNNQGAGTHMLLEDANVAIQKNSYKIERVLCYVIVIISILATIASTYVNVINTIEYVTFTPPCIFNLFNK